MQGVDAVIHLAKQADEGPMEGDELNGKRFDVNVKGTFHLLEAARDAGVKRFIFTSTVMTVLGYEAPQWVDSDAPPRPVGSYALGKQLCEVMCAHYAREFGMSIVCLRIPKPIDLEHPLWKTQPLRPQWVPFPDLMQAYQKALTAEIEGCEVITIVGESSKRRWDLSKAEKLLGYQPRVLPEELGFEMGSEDQPIPAESNYA
jgi:uronate dehydrogenase